MRNIKFIIIAFVLIAVCAGGYLWWHHEFPSASWRYKITITVDTPEGLKTGSAVREVSAYRGPRILGVERAGHARVRSGEAVVVDLGGRGVLFSLIDEDDGYMIVFKTFPFERPALSSEGIRYYASLKAGPVELERNQYPTFVTFTNINDPKSVRQVDPDDLAASFGEGVALSSITLEMTDEPVSGGIEKYLIWLPTLNANLDGSDVTTGSSYANTLHTGYFKRGLK